jgi:hypothetical protein
MIVLLIILCIIVYLIIGGIIAGIIGDDEMDVGMILAWPMLGIALAVYGIVEGAKYLGYAIVNRVKKLLEK